MLFVNLFFNETNNLLDFSIQKIFDRLFFLYFIVLNWDENDMSKFENIVSPTIYKILFIPFRFAIRRKS